MPCASKLKLVRILLKAKVVLATGASTMLTRAVLPCVVLNHGVVTCELLRISCRHASLCVPTHLRMPMDACS